MAGVGLVGRRTTNYRRSERGERLFWLLESAFNTRTRIVFASFHKFLHDCSDTVNMSLQMCIVLHDSSQGLMIPRQELLGLPAF